MTARLFSVLFVLIALRLSAQGVCVLEPIRADHIEGYLLFGFRSQYRIVSRGTMTVRNAKDPEQVIASSEIGQDGSFRVTGVKPGKYILEARSPALISASVDLSVTRPRKKQLARLILVVLGADATRVCGGSSITVESRSKVQETLASASKPMAPPEDEAEHAVPKSDPAELNQ